MSDQDATSGSAKTAVSECLGAWLNYLQILNNLCQSGYKLSQSISALEQWGGEQVAGLAMQQTPQPVFATAWDDLAR